MHEDNNKNEKDEIKMRNHNKNKYDTFEHTDPEEEEVESKIVMPNVTNRMSKPKQNKSNIHTRYDVNKKEVSKNKKVKSQENEAISEMRGQELLDEKAEESIKEVKKKLNEKKNDKKSRKKLVLKLVLLIILFAGSIMVVIPLADELGHGNMVTLGDMVKNINWRFAIYAMLCVVAVILIGTIRLTHITYTTSGKFMPIKCLKIFLVGKFYDYITPMSTGGQPFQIYELSKNGIAGGTATAIPLIRYFIQVFTVSPIALIIFSINSSALDVLEPSVKTFIVASAYLGAFIFMIVPGFLIFVTISPKLGMRMAGFILRLGVKVKLVKDYDKAMKKAENLVAEFKVAMKYAVSNVFHLVNITFLSILETAFIFSIPFFLCVALGGVDPTWDLLTQTFTMALYIYFAVMFVPTPGNSGISESLFVIVFSSIKLSSNVAFWLVLIWRFLTYYVYIILGLLIQLYNFIKAKVVKIKSKKRNKKEHLKAPSESSNVGKKT